MVIAKASHVFTPWCLSTHNSSVPSAGHPMSQEWCGSISLSLSPCPDPLGRGTAMTRTPGKVFRLTLSSGERRCKSLNSGLYVVSIVLFCRNQCCFDATQYTFTKPGVVKWAEQQVPPENCTSRNKELYGIVLMGQYHPCETNKRTTWYFLELCHCKRRNPWDSQKSVCFKRCVKGYRLPWPDPKCCKTLPPQTITYKSEKPQHRPAEPDPLWLLADKVAQPVWPSAPTQQCYRAIETWFLMSIPAPVCLYKPLAIMQNPFHFGMTVYSQQKESLCMAKFFPQGHRGQQRDELVSVRNCLATPWPPSQTTHFFLREATCAITSFQQTANALRSNSQN